MAIPTNNSCVVQNFYNNTFPVVKSWQSPERDSCKRSAFFCPLEERQVDPQLFRTENDLSGLVVRSLPFSSNLSSKISCLVQPVSITENDRRTEEERLIFLEQEAKIAALTKENKELKKRIQDKDVADKNDVDQLKVVLIQQQEVIQKIQALLSNMRGSLCLKI